MINKVIQSGRVANDLQIRVTNNGTSVCEITLAVSKGKDKGADFFNWVAFKGSADVIAKYFKKGGQVILEGMPYTTSYTNKEGKKVTQVRFMVDNFDFGAKKESKEAKESIDMPAITDDDLPF